VAVFGLEDELGREAVVAHLECQLADNGDHQALTVHVGALDRDLAQFAEADLAQLLELILVVAAVARARRPS
jgi:hypothetical protein